MAPEDLILGSEWVWGPLGAIYMAVSGAKFFTLWYPNIYSSRAKPGISLVLDIVDEHLDIG